MSDEDVKGVKMLSSDAAPSATVNQRRTAAASRWLASSRKTGADCIKIMIGGSCITIHASSGAILLFRLDWTGSMIVFTDMRSNEHYRFYEMTSAVTLFDSVLASYIAAQSEPDLGDPEFSEAVTL